MLWLRNIPGHTIRIVKTFACLCALSLAACAHAQTMPEMPAMHNHADDAASNPEKLGQVSFPNSCAASVQTPIVRGVALLHSFAYAKAQMQFETIVQQDPACAIAHWGVAMTQFQELWGEPDPNGLKRGAEQMEKARTLAAQGPITPREQAYIAALSAFFDPSAQDFQQRADAYEARMNALHRDYPGDVEAAAFDALAILASTPPGDTSLTHEHQALAILTPLFAKHPGHPGLAHYIIHTCDTPALAPEGLQAAREYGRIAPASPHALHMPGHIFARLGMWPEDIDSNLASVTASEQAEAAGQPGGAHQMHAEEFLIYAYLQIGEDEKARTLLARMPAIGDHMHTMPGMDDMKEAGSYFVNELNTIFNAEMHDWHALAIATPAPRSRPGGSQYVSWGQGIAAGHLKDPALASRALAGYEQSFAAMKKDDPAALPGMEIKRNELIAWKAFTDSRPEAAVASMREAANQQDKLGQGEVDIPAREMLGDLLLLEHQPEAALAEYRIELKLSPNRLNGELSAGEAAEQAHHPAEARAFYAEAAHQTGDAAHSRRAGLMHAVQSAGATVALSERECPRP